MKKLYIPFILGLVLFSCSFLDVDSNNEENTSDKFVLVEGGSFSMGDTLFEGETDESPVHEVNLGSYYIGKYELTHEDFILFLNQNEIPSTGFYNGNKLVVLDEVKCAIAYKDSSFIFVSSVYAENDSCPVMDITWFGAIEYCNWLSEQETLNPCYTISQENVSCDFEANGYRLPTEAEWEYAVRGGVHSIDNYRYSGCNETAELLNYAWFSENSSGIIHPVGEKEPNQLGIYDMNGNAYEWCWDWYGDDYYNTNTSINPKGPDTGQFHVVRGGSRFHNFLNCRVADRNIYPPSESDSVLGFRIAKNKF